jgi:hypothetical protein
MYTKFDRKTPGKDTTWRTEDNIRTDPREIGWEDMDWMGKAQDRDQWWALVNTAMNLQIHKRRRISCLSDH